MSLPVVDLSRPPAEAFAQLRECLGQHGAEASWWATPIPLRGEWSRDVLWFVERFAGSPGGGAWILTGAGAALDGHGLLMQRADPMAKRSLPPDATPIGLRLPVELGLPWPFLEVFLQFPTRLNQQVREAVEAARMPPAAELVRRQLVGVIEQATVEAMRAAKERADRIAALGAPPAPPAR